MSMAVVPGCECDLAQRSQYLHDAKQYAAAVQDLRAVLGKGTGRMIECWQRIAQAQDADGEHTAAEGSCSMAVRYDRTNLLLRVKWQQLRNKLDMRTSDTSLREGQHIECTSDVIVKQSENSELVQTTTNHLDDLRVSQWHNTASTGGQLRSSDWLVPSVSD